MRMISFFNAATGPDESSPAKLEPGSQGMLALPGRWPPVSSRCIVGSRSDGLRTHYMRRSSPHSTFPPDFVYFLSPSDWSPEQSQSETGLLSLDPCEISRPADASNAGSISCGGDWGKPTRQRSRALLLLDLTHARPIRWSSRIRTLPPARPSLRLQPTTFSNITFFRGRKSLVTTTIIPSVTRKALHLITGHG